MRRTLGLVLLVLLLAAGGCLGDGGQSTPAGGETGTVPETPTAAADTAMPEAPPGVSENDVENASALLAAHQSVLETHAYYLDTNTTTTATNGSVLGTSDPWTFEVGEPGAPTLVTIRPNDRGSVLQRWYNDSVYLVKTERSNGETQYQRKFPGDIPERPHRVLYADLANASAGEKTSIDRVTRDGRALVRIQGLTVANSGTEQTTRLSMLVQSNGLIREYSVNTTRPPGARDYDVATHQVREFRIDSVAESGGPGRPDWVETALEETMAYD